MQHATSNDSGAHMHLRILTRAIAPCTHLVFHEGMGKYKLVLTPDNCTCTLKMIEQYQLLLTWPKDVTGTLFACQEFATKCILF